MEFDPLCKSGRFVFVQVVGSRCEFCYNEDAADCEAAELTLRQLSFELPDESIGAPSTRVKDALRSWRAAAVLKRVALCSPVTKWLISSWTSPGTRMISRCTRCGY